MIFQKTNKRLLELEEGYKDLYLKYRTLEDQASCNHETKVYNVGEMYVYVHCDDCKKIFETMTIKEYHQAMVEEHTAELNE